MGSVSEMLDVEFSPHPCEIVGGRRIVVVSALKRPVLQVLEPDGEVFAGRGWYEDVGVVSDPSPLPNIQLALRHAGVGLFTSSRVGVRTLRLEELRAVGS